MNSAVEPVDVLLVHDPLCGWCFGSIPETNRLADLLDATGYSWSLACGGLVTGERVRPVSADADYLRAGLEVVKQTTGQRAGQRFFNEALVRGTYVSASEPLVRLLHVLRSEGARQQLRFGHHLSSAFYRLGLEPTDPEVIEHGLLTLGIDAGPVLDLWSAPETIRATSQWMEQSRQLGAETYPSVLVKTSGGYVAVSKGFDPANSVFAAIEKTIQIEKTIHQRAE